MGKLRSLTLAAKIRTLTHIKPIHSNAMNWISTYAMLKRYSFLKPL